MRLSTKARFAMAAMIELAARSTTGPIRLADISVHQGVSVSYLEQLFSRLRKHGLVTGARGPGGGYRLGRNIEDISVADILVAVDNNSLVQKKEDVWHWQGNNRNLPNALWRDLSRQLYDFLQGISLADVVETDNVQSAITNSLVEAISTGSGQRETRTTH